MVIGAPLSDLITIEAGNVWGQAFSQLKAFYVILFVNIYMSTIPTTLPIALLETLGEFFLYLYDQVLKRPPLLPKKRHKGGAIKRATIPGPLPFIFPKNIEAELPFPDYYPPFSHLGLKVLVRITCACLSSLTGSTSR